MRIVDLLAWGGIGQFALVVTLIAALYKVATSHGTPNALLWQAIFWTIFSLLMSATALLLIILFGWFGVLVAIPLLTAGAVSFAFAWLCFDQWRKGRRRSPGRLHGWVIRVVEGRLRLMPTPA